jgi:hypothetical protein
MKVSAWRNSGATVSISATPNDGYSFSNWTGSGAGSYSGPDNPASIMMNGPITETATFSHNRAPDLHSTLVRFSVLLQNTTPCLREDRGQSPLLTEKMKS